MRSERKAELSRSLAESLAQLSIQVRNWIRDHPSLSGILGGGGALGLLVWGGLSVFWGYQYESGLAALDDGLQEIRNSAPDKAAIRLQLAADRLSGQARQLALIQLGFAYEEQGETEKAAAMYEQVIDGAAVKNYLSQIALIKLARIAQSRDDQETAKDFFRKAADLDGPGKEDALLGVAQILEQANDVEGAQSYYQKYLDTAPGAALQEVAESKVG